MLQVFEMGWLWIIVGLVILIAGYRNLDTPPRQWLAFLFDLPFTLTTESTNQEKQRNDQPVEDAMAATPGCGLMLVGLLFIVFGFFRVFT